MPEFLSCKLWLTAFHNFISLKPSKKPTNYKRKLPDFKRITPPPRNVTLRSRTTPTPQILPVKEEPNKILPIKRNRDLLSQEGEKQEPEISTVKPPSDASSPERVSKKQKLNHIPIQAAEEAEAILRQSLGEIATRVDNDIKKPVESQPDNDKKSVVFHVSTSNHPKKA